MDGTLLIATQRSNLSWQQVCSQFAPRLGLTPEVLFHALLESITVYRKAIEQVAEKQRRDRLDPFAVRQETVEVALVHIGIEDTALAVELVRSYGLLHERHLGLASHALDIFRALRGRTKRRGLIMNGNATY